MITERLQRRTAILRGKRTGSFDRDQYYLEHARRARVARKLRCYLRDMRPVMLAVPRWGGAQTLLDDVAVDVNLGNPAVRSRTLSVRPLEGRTPHQTWNWLVHGLMEFCGSPADTKASQVVNRHGFRVVLAELFRHAEMGPRQCLMIHGLESLQVDALHDLLSVFEDHIHHRGDQSGFNLVLAGPSAVPHLDLHGVERLTLEDYDDQEAVEALAEQVGPDNQGTLQQIIARVGGIPEVLSTLGAHGPGAMPDVAGDGRSLWQALGTLGQHIRRTLDIVAADTVMSARLEQLAREQGCRHDPERDPPLVEAGLVRLVGPPMPRNEAAGVRIAPWARKRRAELRSPLFLELISR